MNRTPSRNLTYMVGIACMLTVLWSAWRIAGVLG